MTAPLKPTLDGKDAICNSMKRYPPQQYCEIFIPNCTFSGGLVNSFCMEVVKEHIEPIEDEE